MKTLSLVGRTSVAEITRFASGTVRADFRLTVNSLAKGQVTFEIEAWGKESQLAAGLADGQLVSLIGSVSEWNPGGRVRATGLEIVGQPRCKS